MPQFTVGRKPFLAFLKRFGTTIGDLRLLVGDNKVTGTVGRYTHYLTTSMTCSDTESGALIIGDLSKATSFLRNASAKDVSVKQTKPGTMLYLTCGNAKVHLPSAPQAASFSQAGVIAKLVAAAENSGWTEWCEKEVGCYGQAVTESFGTIKDIHKVLGANALYHVHFMAEENELVVKAGKQSKGRMFITIPLENTKGPVEKCVSAFGAHFPQLIETLPGGSLEIHGGEGVVMCVKHDETDTVLVIIDQDYEEGWE